MHKKTTFSVILCLIAVCFQFVSCSKIDSLIDEVGLGDVKDKIDAAWSEAGKEAFDDLIDDIWREYGFGRSLSWPEKNNGSHIPKLRSGNTEFSVSSDSGSCGVICMNGISHEDEAAYIKDLTEYGYKKTSYEGKITEYYVCDGLYIALLNENGLFYICYGNSEQEVSDAFDFGKEPENQ